MFRAINTLLAMDLLFLLLTYVCLHTQLPGFVRARNHGKDTQVACKDENGDTVDWFYLYKLPKHYITTAAAASTSSSLDKSGLHYLFITSKSYENWQLSLNKINESFSMPALTLEPLFNNPLVLIVAYNDQFPNGTVIFNGGHAKGLVATDGITGLWLIHSVPKFTTIPRYEYPSTGAHYGQSFLCVSLSAAEIEKVGEQLIFNEANIYYNRIPINLDGKFPKLEKAINKEWIKEQPFSNIMDLSTLEGNSFKSFAKSGKYNKELYDDLVAPTLDTNLLVETWRNGEGNLPTNCSLNDNVYNIEELNNDDLDIDFKTTEDHSKWAVSQKVGLKFWRWRLPTTSNWICVGDINRQQHQLVRGGGVLCQQHGKVANLYRKLILRYEECSN